MSCGPKCGGTAIFVQTKTKITNAIIRLTEELHIVVCFLILIALFAILAVVLRTAPQNQKRIISFWLQGDNCLRVSSRIAKRFFFQAAVRPHVYAGYIAYLMLRTGI
jgi:hypothetical protein